MKVKNCIPLTTVTRIYYLCHIRESLHERRIKIFKEVPVFLAVVTNDAFPASVSLGCGVPPLPTPELPPNFLQLSATSCPAGHGLHQARLK